MKYYLRELKGTFDRCNLFEVPDDVDISKIEPGNSDPKGSIGLAHSNQFPRGYLTEKLAPDQTDFDEHWYLGEAKTSSGYGYGGHHLGECTEITEEEAKKLMQKVYQEVLNRLAKQIKDEGYDIRAKWTDEHGREQSVISNVNFVVEMEKTNG